MWTADRPPQWVGRGQELAILGAGVEALGRGEGAVVWVDGEPGIGKSSLVAEALAVGGSPGWDVLDGTAPVIGCGTVIEAQLLAGLAYRAMGDRCAADQSAERALALAEADRLVLPFAMTGSRELLEALPRHQTAHAARPSTVPARCGSSQRFGDSRRMGW
jgi:hypothetical protein